MKFTIKHSDLIKATSHIQSIVERKTTVPILSNVKLTAEGDTLTINATDMEIELSEHMEINGIEEGTATTPAHTLHDIVKKLPSNAEIEFELSDTHIDMKAGRARFKLVTLASDEFPVIKVNTFENSFKIASETLAYLINKSRFAISTEETRYYLNGIYMHATDDDEGNIQVLRAVATDGHRLARIEVELPAGAETLKGIIVPRKTVNEVFKILETYDEEVTVSFNETLIQFEIGDIIITSKLIDGSFPDYLRVIPQNNEKILDINAKELAESVDRVSTVSSDRSRAIKLEMTKDSLKLAASSVSNNEAEEDIEIAWDRDDFTIGFNGKYLLDIINQIEEENVTFQFGQSSEPAILKDVADPSLLYVLMPMRV